MDQTSVLLVDDEDSFRDVLARRLDHRGFAVEQAASGRAALERMGREDIEPPRVVVLDVKMPDMDGLETLKRIRTAHDYTEVILLTGQASTQDGVSGMKAGAFDYLTKPVEIEHLAGKIRQAREKVERKIEREREAAFRARMRQNMVAAERLAALGTLAAGVAHEINNPLAVINDAAGWLKLMLQKPEAEGFPLAKLFDKGLSKIEKSVERARLITHQLLGFARKDETFVAEVDPAALVRETLQLVGKEARNKEIALAAEDGGAPLVFTDPNQLRQVLVNLLTNAIQAMDKGGSISVRTEPDVPMETEAAAKPAETGARILVADTGPGIPEDLKARIFEPFFSTKAPGVGTGLGLSVSLGIVQALGGNLSVESEVGRGATFTVRLPRTYVAKPGEGPGAAENGPDWLDMVKCMTGTKD